MYENYDVPLETVWMNGNYEDTKDKVISILKEQKASLSETRYLFHMILNEIETNNPVTI